MKFIEKAELALLDKNKMTHRQINFNSAGNEAYNKPIQLHELEFALSKVGNSAPGPDEICYKMLKKLDTAAKTKLLDIFNKILM